MAQRDTSSDLRRNMVRAMLTDDEYAMVQRVAARYGDMSISSAARLLIIAGAAQHDPSLPPKNNP